MKSSQRPDPDIGDVVGSLLEIDPFRGPDPLPTRIVTRFDLFGDIQSLFLASKAECLEIRGIGKGTIRLLDLWVQRQTHRLGHRLGLDELRQLLSQASPEDDGPTLPSARPQAGSSISVFVQYLPITTQRLRPVALPDLAVRTRIVLKAVGIKKLEDLTKYSEREILAWPGLDEACLENLREVLLRLAEDCERAEGEPASTVEEILRTRWLRDPLLERFAIRLAELSDRERDVLEQRYLDSRPRNLRSIAREVGVTGSRIQQIDARAKRRSTDDGLLSFLVDEKIKEQRQGRSTPLSVNELEQVDSWFEGVTEGSRYFGRLLELCESKHRVLTLDGEDKDYVVPSQALDFEHQVKMFRKAMARASENLTLEQIAGKFCKSSRYPELTSLLLRNVGAVIVARNGYVDNPTLGNRIEAILLQSSRPMTEQDIMDALEGQGISVGQRSVAGHIGELKHHLLILGPKLYLHERRVGRVGDYKDLVPLIDTLMRTKPGYQWSLHAIQIGLQKAGAYEKRGIPPQILIMLLRELPMIQELGRGIWTFGEEPVRRLHVVEIGSEILREYGAPMPMEELLDRIRSRRSLGPNLTVKWPLVHLTPPLIGLCSRDLGIPDATFFLLLERTNAALKSTRGRLGPDELRAFLTELAPDLASIPPNQLARLLLWPPISLLDGNDDGLRHHSQPRC